MPPLRRLHWGAVAGVWVAACQAASPAVTTPDDAPADSPRTAKGAAPDPPTPARWEHFDTFTTWPTLVTFESRGHWVEHRSARIRTPPQFAERYRAWTRGLAFEPGTVLIQEHLTASEQLAELFVMTRDKRGWRYELVSPEGAIVPDSAPDLCAACHASATSDSVFGPRRQ